MSFINGFYYIYKIINIINGKIYVGQRKSKVIPENDIKYFGSGVVIKSSIKKYGKDNFEKEIIEICNSININEREIFWICKLNSMLPNGYNLTEGGDGFRGMKFSQEHKINLSKAIKKSITPERRKMMSEVAKNRVDSMETRAKKSKSFLGRKHSEETKNKLRELNLGKVPTLSTRVLWSKQRKGREAWNKGKLSSEESKLKSSLAHTGIKLSEITRERISKSNMGKIISEETKNKISNSHKNLPLIICPHCNLESKNKTCMNRWHFNNCKMN